MEEFYIVWAEGGSTSVMCRTESDAVKVAEASAKDTPGQAYIVLKSVKYCMAENPVNWFSMVSRRG